MNWKITVLGIVAILLLLTAFSTANIVFGYVAEHLGIYIPEAELTDVTMYGSSYKNTGGEEMPSIYQEIATMECPSGQVISRNMTLTDYPEKGWTTIITAWLTMAYVKMGGVNIYAWNLTSSGGTLNGVNMTAEAFPKGVVQHIDSATMYDLKTFIWNVYVTSMKYENLVIRIEIKAIPP